MGGETANIAEMAARISKEVFRRFLWEPVGPVDTNWECLNPEHNRKTHPSDVVYAYQDPYLDERVYVNADLKSYACTSITSGKIGGAVHSLSTAIDCAATNEDWQKTYAVKPGNWRCDGLLFIYNHDGEFEADFHTKLRNAPSKNIAAGKAKRLFVLGPKRIEFLANVANDISLALTDDVPLSPNYGFYYPDLVRHRHQAFVARAPASLEMLTAPWLTVSNGEASYIVYVALSDPEIEDFTFLIDSFFRYQMLDRVKKISVRLVNPLDTTDALTKFSRARERFIASPYVAQDRLSHVECSAVTRVIARYDQYQIGMER